MNGSHYFPLYYQRLLASTSGWKDDEFGAYVRLLIHQFDRGGIPDDLTKLSRIAPSIKKHWPVIKDKFHAVEGSELLINDVMDDVRKEVEINAERSRNNGKKGGRPKTQQQPSGLVVGYPAGTQQQPEPGAINQKPNKHASVYEEVFRIMRGATDQTFSDDLLQREATSLIAKYGSNGGIKDIGSVISKWMPFVKPDIPKKKMQY